MRERKCREAFWIVLVLSGCLSSFLLYGQTATSKRGVQDSEASRSPTPSLQSGPYYALVIGNNNYKYLNKLQTSINDASEVAQLLEQRYGFHTHLLLDADRNQILTALVEYRRTLPEDSNLLIYYAGHGHHDHDTDEAYWLPVDAVADNNANWISADDITRNVRAVPSAHILVISDSCYSGFLSRGTEAAINPRERSAYLAKMLKSKSRNLMSSGGDEPVADSGAPGHSVFAGAILESLRQMEDDNFTAASLFQRFIQPRVGGRSDQLPQYSWIRNSGHDAGDFVFFRVPASGGGSQASPVLNPAKSTVVVAGDHPHAVVKGSSAGSKPAASATVRMPSVPKNLGWIAGDKGTILHTEDGGASWKPQHSGTTKELTSLTFVTTRSGWAVGFEGTILHTEDGGGNWKLQSGSTREDLLSVVFATTQSGWAVGRKGTILHTENGGGSWEPQRSSTDAILDSVAFATEKSGCAVGYAGTILHTENGGRSWEQSSSGTDYLDAVAFASPQSGLIIGQNGLLLQTEDGGGSWVRKQDGVGNQSHSLAFATPQSGWAVGEDGIIMHTEDGGLTWKPQGSGTRERLESVAFASPQSGWTVGDGIITETILRTDDGGLTWNPQHSGIHERLNSVAFVTPK